MKKSVYLTTDETFIFDQNATQSKYKKQKLSNSEKQMEL